VVKVQKHGVFQRVVFYNAIFHPVKRKNAVNVCRLFVLRGSDTADAAWAGKETTVTSAYRIPAVNSAAARNLGNAPAKKDGADSSATKVEYSIILSCAGHIIRGIYCLMCRSFSEGEMHCFVLRNNNNRLTAIIQVTGTPLQLRTEGFCWSRVQ